MNNQLKKILKNLKNNLKNIYNNELDAVILYGSQARNEAFEGSDIDVLILLNDEVKPIQELRKINEFLTEISLKFNQVISCVFMSKKRYESEQSPLILNIKKEGIVL